MKSRTLLTCLLIFSFTFSSCEKSIIDEENDDKKPKVDIDDKDDEQIVVTPGHVGDVIGSTGGADDKGEGKGTMKSPLNVYAFINYDFDCSVWVQGYIVGAATGASGNKYVFDEPYKYATAIMLADNSEEKDLSNVMTVQLASGSKIRRELNLVDHPENKGKKVVLYGERVRYLKCPGIKSIQAYMKVDW